MFSALQQSINCEPDPLQNLAWSMLQTKLWLSTDQDLKHWFSTNQVVNVWFSIDQTLQLLILTALKVSRLDFAFLLFSFPLWRDISGVWTDIVRRTQTSSFSPWTLSLLYLYPIVKTETGKWHSSLLSKMEDLDWFWTQQDSQYCSIENYIPTMLS